MWREALLLGFALGLAGCANDGPERTGQSSSFTLRVSTHFDLVPMAPGDLGGMTAQLQDLVYARLHEHFAVARGEGNFVRLTRLPESGADIHQLMDALDHPSLLSKRLVDARTIEIELSDVNAATDTDRGAMLNIGPYTPASYVKHRLVLRRRSMKKDRPQFIDVVNVRTEEEEWRRFLARDVDLIPFVSPSSARHLATVPSVRLVPVPQMPDLVINFNMRRGGLDLSLRRALSLALRREALADFAAGTKELATESPENLEKARQILRDRTGDGSISLRLIVHSGTNEWQRTALAIQHQLSMVGVEVSIRTLSLAELPGVLYAGDYDLFVHVGDFSRRRLALLRSSDPGNLTKYASDEFDRAFADGNLARCREIVRRDLPFTPLFRLPAYVVVDRNLCGIRPATPTDFSWLADVHPCAPGEVE